MQLSFTLAVLVLLTVLAGCTTPLDSGLTRCTEPRPQICTNEYNPVCATLSSGRKETRPTGCTACAEASVVGWVMGACKVSGR